MAAPVVRDDAVAVLDEEQHLRVPVIGRERPAVAEHDGLSLAPILVEDLNAIFGRDGAHIAPRFRWFTPRHISRIDGRALSAIALTQRIASCRSAMRPEMGASHAPTPAETPAHTIEVGSGRSVCEQSR